MYSLNTSLGNGWVYNYAYNYIAPPSSNFHGLLAYRLYISNTGWTGYYNSTPNMYFYNGSYLYGSGSQTRGNSYFVNFLIPIKTGTTQSRYGQSGSFRNHATIVGNVASQIATQMTAPTLAAGTVYAKPINANRFALQTDSKQEYNLTNSGTSPFNFQTEELTGTLDGYYSVDTVTDTTIGNFSRFEIPKREIGIGHTQVVTVSNNTYITKPNYKMRTSQKVVYNNTGGNPAHGIPGLTDGQTYYAIADGPDHFRLADSILNANGGNAISIATTSAGSFTFVTPSIAGLSAGAGTCGISSTKAVVTGEGSLFKRFLSAGDNFIYKDTTASPPEYRIVPIASVIDDDELSLTTSPGTEIASTNYYIETKINTRPDGAFLHRPFDGGVEIDAGTSPNSSIVRQTRKYFRYQSGKGIQCSLAINFNPSRVATSLVSSGNTALPSEVYRFNLNSNEGNSWNVSGYARDGQIFGENPPITIVKGDYLTFSVNAPGQPLWIKTAPTTGVGDSVAAVGNWY